MFENFPLWILFQLFKSKNKATNVRNLECKYAQISIFALFDKTQEKNILNY